MSDKIGQNKFGIYNCKVCNFENKPGLYSCKVCDYITSRNSQYIRHIATSKHKRLTEIEDSPKKSPTNIKIFSCKLCYFECPKKGDYNRHLMTAKHKILNNPNYFTSKNITSYTCDNCNKIYKHASSLCNHKKKCNYKAIDTNSEIIQLLKQNIELHKSLIELSI